MIAITLMTIAMALMGWLAVEFLKLFFVVSRWQEIIGSVTLAAIFVSGALYGITHQLIAP